MFAFILKKMFGTQNERFLKKIRPMVDKINSFEEEVSRLSQEELKGKTVAFRKQIRDTRRPWQEKIDSLSEALNSALVEERVRIEDELKAIRKKLKSTTEEVLEEILPYAFAMAREAAKRTLGMRHFDVQFIGGIVLHKGMIAEMANGEGKTLAATSPVYLNALAHEGVHVVTVNDYLAKRDREWMGPVYEYLGLTVGVIQNDMPHEEKRAAYACDITYGTNNEFGFDYLRDNMVLKKENQVQARRYYAVVDEVDSILVDEARTPLIISGPTEESTEKYYEVNKIITHLKKGAKDEVTKAESGDFVIDEKSKSVYLTDDGEVKASELLNVKDNFEFQMKYRHLVTQGLRAHYNFNKDTDYVVKDGQVIIVDEFTGRLMSGRRWSDGLHQAVEAKEKLKIERENQTLATITLQNYFRMYEKLSGMTGTGLTEAGEFAEIYKLEVVAIPTNNPIQRVDATDLIYKSFQEKFEAVCDKVKEVNDSKRPVLVGTTSIEKNELLSRMMKRRGIPHQVLNAKYHETEAHIVAQAGRPGAVTIATNMAGRGTDIRLGGNADYIVEDFLRQQKIGPYDSNYKEEYEKLYKRFSQEVTEEKNKVMEMGGLYVIGTERHESRRIDNQLRGRAGRQGTPGYSQFYLSLEDDLMRIFGSDRIKGIMQRFGFAEGESIHHPLITRSIETAQRRVEGYNFEIRKHLLEYDNVMNKQREIIYEERNAVLNLQSSKEHILSMTQDVLNSKIDLHLNVESHVEPDDDTMRGWLSSVYGIDASGIDLKSRDLPEIENEIFSRIQSVYEEKEKSIGTDNMRYLEKIITLQVIDRHWKDHLYGMDELRDGIGLRAYGQKNPLIEYQQEAHDLFSQMTNRIKEEASEVLFKIAPTGIERGERFSVFASTPMAFRHEEKKQFESSSLSETGDVAVQQRGLESAKAVSQPVRHAEEKVGRNELCPCGSGKKYKKCCGK
ncbi:MAG: preprotein translocase subunit SecA [Candidatus Omnitrophota bacterium]